MRTNSDSFFVLVCVVAHDSNSDNNKTVNNNTSNAQANMVLPLLLTAFV